MAKDFGGIVDALPGLLWTTRDDGVSDFVNRRWCDYTGLATDVAHGRGWESAIHPDDLEPILASWEVIRTTGVDREIEGRLRRFDGEYRWFAFRLSRLPAATGGAQWCWLGLDADETSTGADRPMPDGRLRRLMNMLPAQILFMTPSMELEFVNREVADFYGRSLDELSQWNRSGDIHPDDLPGTFERVERLLKFGETWDFQNRMRRADGTYRWVRSRMVPSRDAAGNIVRYCSIQTDVHDLEQAKDLLAGEVRLLEMVALGRPLPETLDGLGRILEELSAGCLCSILIVAPDRKHFRVGAGPSLPDRYNAILDGETIDPDYSPCSLAVVQKAPIITADSQSDPRWAASIWPTLMREHTLRSCWSIPIVSASGEASGVVAVYRREPAGPTPYEQELIDRFAKIAGIAIDGAQADEELRASEGELRRAHAQLSEAQRLSKTGSFTSDLQLDQHSWSEELFRIFEIDPTTPPSVQVVRDRLHPADLPLFDSEIQRSITGADTDFRIRIVTPEAGIKHLRCAARVIEHVAGRPIFIGTIQDITASKLAEEELRRSETYLLEAQRLSKTGSYSWLTDTDEIVFSSELRRIFGLDNDVPIIAEGLLERVHADDVHLAVAQMEAARNGRDVDFVLRLQMPDGSIKYVREFGHMIRNQAGRPELIGSVQDVTESKMAEATLIASEGELRRAYDYLTEAQRLSRTGSFTWDVLADEHNWSAEIRRIFGFGLDAVITIGMIQGAIYPDDMAEVELVIGGAAEGRNFDLFFRILTAEGEVRHAHVVGRRIEEIEDRPVFLGALQDVTESMVAEAALRTNEAELRRTNRFLTTAQRVSKTGSFIWDHGANERQWSEEMYRIFEQDLNGAVPSGMNQELIHPEDLSTYDSLVRRASEGQDFDGEFRLLMPSGKVKTLHVVGNSLNGSADAPVFVGAAQDVTELKLREDALNTARAQLAHVARVTTLSTLTASIAHEVSQPLSGILTNANTCLRMLAAKPPNLEGVAESARRTIRDTDRATEVIKRLRALFARKTPTIEPIDLNEAAREIIALTSSELQRSRVIVQTEFAGDLPTVYGDRIQLQQVILNLVMNAADAMVEVEDRQRITVVQTHRDRGGRVELSVRDAGPGIDPQTIEKLFDAFYTTKAHGMGVGLSISRSIIESHEGRLWASANDGPGATFSFSIPCAPGLASASNSQSSS